MDQVNNTATDLGNSLLEASCVGDLKTVTILLALNVNVNFANKVNGWTALHWACKRGHTDIVKVLISHGADVNIANTLGQQASDLTNNESILLLLGVNSNLKSIKKDLEPFEFVPNYMKYPPLNPTVEIPLKISKSS